jgi:hypothetical protein
MDTNKFMTPDDYFLPSDDMLPCEPTGDVPSLPVVTPLGTPIVAMSFDDAKALWQSIAPTARYYRKVGGSWQEIAPSTYRLLTDFLADTGGRGTFLKLD